MPRGRKPGKPLKTQDIDAACFDKAIKYRKLSIREMGRDSELGISDRTLRRYRKGGKITPENLEKLAKYLDVHVDFLSGKYSRMIEESGYSEELKAQCLDDLKPDRFRYEAAEVREASFREYMNGLLNVHGIPWEHYENLDPEIRYQLNMELENSIINILRRYFQPILDDEMWERLYFPFIGMSESDVPDPTEEEIAELIGAQDNTENGAVALRKMQTMFPRCPGLCIQKA